MMIVAEHEEIRGDPIGTRETTSGSREWVRTHRMSPERTSADREHHHRAVRVRSDADSGWKERQMMNSGCEGEGERDGERERESGNAVRRRRAVGDLVGGDSSNSAGWSKREEKKGENRRTTKAA